MNFSVFHSGECYPNNPTFTVLYNISEAHYLYLKSWTKHKYLQQSAEGLDNWWENLFKGEPIDMYSNVENGYGVFMSRTTDSIRMECL